MYVMNISIDNELDRCK